MASPMPVPAYSSLWCSRVNISKAGTRTIRRGSWTPELCWSRVGVELLYGRHRQAMRPTGSCPDRRSRTLARSRSLHSALWSWRQGEQRPTDQGQSLAARLWIEQRCGDKWTRIILRASGKPACTHPDAYEPSLDVLSATPLSSPSTS